MRISFVLSYLLCITCMLLASSKSFGQKELDKNIRVNFKNVSLKEALEELQTKHQIPLAYSNDESILSNNINYSGNKLAKEVLADILKNQNMTYEVRHGFVRLVKRSSPSSIKKNVITQQQREITGRVTNQEGETLAGVSVGIKERPTVGTTTDINGRYILAVTSPATLVFQMVGYKTVEVPVGDQTSIHATLDPTETGIDEVVVVGFGTQKKISLVGAQSSVNAKDLQIPVANLTNAITGRLAGAIGVQRTGEPGFDNSDIWVRGISTFSESLSTPLVLVDGTPREMANVDPEDIESFSILKDAAATAVYGVRGANGVVLIKTKSGQAGKPTFNFRYYEGITQFTKLPEFADGITYMNMANEARANRGASPYYSEERIRATAGGEDPYLYPNVDWMGALFNNFGNQRRANLNVSGGSDRITYYVSTSFFDELGLYKTDELVKYDNSASFKRYNLTQNLNIKATNTTKIDVGVQGYLANANYPGSGQQDIFQDAWFVTPVIHPIRFENGYLADQLAGRLVNPYGQLTETGYANQWRSQLFSNLRVTQDLPFITQGLSATSMFSFDTYNYTSMRRLKRPDTYLAAGRDADGNMLYQMTHEGEQFLSYSPSRRGNRTIYIEAALNYNRSFGKHDVSGMLLYNQSDMMDSQASNFENSLPFRFLGISGRATYGYDNRYFLEANFGYNGAENFHPDRRYGFFPSVGLGWVFSEEPFLAPVKEVFPVAKIRFSHGQVGNSQISGGRRFAYLSTIGNRTGYNFGLDRNNGFGGRDIDEYAVNVTWETATKTNIGLDLQTANNALNIQFDLFKERREGIFLRRGNVPSYLGLQNAPYGNLGIIENKGFDGSITYSKTINQFMFQLMGNVTFTRNKIIENDQPNPLYPWMDQRGLKTSQRFGLLALGLFESQEEIATAPLHPGTVQPGDIKFKDINGDGRIDDFDRVPIGYGTIPELVYGVGFTVGYKAVSLSALFQGVGNTDIRMNGEGLMPFTFSVSRGNLLSNIEDRWTIENPKQDAFYPRLSEGSPNANFDESTWWLQNGRYVRLKNLQLNYRLPEKFVDRIKLNNASIFFSGYNLFTWSPFTFWDVELGDGRGTRYPNITSYTLGLNINF